MNHCRGYYDIRSDMPNICVRCRKTKNSHQQNGRRDAAMIVAEIRRYKAQASAAAIEKALPEPSLPHPGFMRPQRNIFRRSTFGPRVRRTRNASIFG